MQPGLQQEVVLGDSVVDEKLGCQHTHQAVLKRPDQRLLELVNNLLLYGCKWNLNGLKRSLPGPDNPLRAPWKRSDRLRLSGRKDDVAERRHSGISHLGSRDKRLEGRRRNLALPVRICGGFRERSRGIYAVKCIDPSADTNRTLIVGFMA